MARTADPDLPARILKSAERLWQAGGDAKVTIRGVAENAGTTTPTVYSYFADRDALLAALRAEAYRRFSTFMKASRDFDHCCELYLQFGERNARDYELLYGQGWRERADLERMQLESEVIPAMLARGGMEPGLATRRGYAIMMMLHGAVMQRLSSHRSGPLWSKIRSACLEACKELAKP